MIRVIMLMMIKMSLYRSDERLVKLKFHRSSFLVASSWHFRRHARHPREDYTKMSRVSGVSGDFPVQLATGLPDWSAGGVVLPCPFVRVSCRSPNSTNATRTTCCGHPRENATRLPRFNCSGHFKHVYAGDDWWYEDATRKLLPWNSSLTARGASADTNLRFPRRSFCVVLPISSWHKRSRDSVNRACWWPSATGPNRSELKLPSVCRPWRT